MFEVVLLGRARSQIEALAPDERSEIEDIIRIFELDPWVDGYRKFDLPMPPVVIRVYDDGRWRVSNRVAGDRFLEIYALGRSERR